MFIKEWVSEWVKEWQQKEFAKTKTNTAQHNTNATHNTTNLHTNTHTYIHFFRSIKQTCKQAPNETSIFKNVCVPWLQHVFPRRCWPASVHRKTKANGAQISLEDGTQSHFQLGKRMGREKKIDKMLATSIHPFFFPYSFHFFFFFVDFSRHLNKPTNWAANTGQDETQGDQSLLRKLRILIVLRNTVSMDFF